MSVTWTETSVENAFCWKETMSYRGTQTKIQIVAKEVEGGFWNFFMLRRYGVRCVSDDIGAIGKSDLAEICCSAPILVAGRRSSQGLEVLPFDCVV